VDINKKKRIMNNEGYPIYGEEEDPQVAINTRDMAALNQEVGSLQTETNIANQDINILQGRVNDIDDVVLPVINKHIGDLGKQVTTIADGLGGANSEMAF
jgi:predicted secreted protein